MYIAVSGIYEDGKVFLTETPPTTKKSQVIILFMEEIETGSSIESGKGQNDISNDLNK